MSYKGDKAVIAERRLKALEMRKAGFSYRKIGEQLGVSYQTAYKDVLACIKEIQEESSEKAEQLKTIELQRIDTAISALWPRVIKGKEQAINTMLRLMERRAKYLGLDAPVRTESKIEGVETIVLLPETDDEPNT